MRHKEEIRVSRVYNFSAGPAVLPEEVLQEAAAEMMDYKGSGMSVMEMSHRSKWFDDIIKDAEKDLRELMNIPDNYKVLFLQGGASQFFAEVPMNLMAFCIGRSFSILERPLFPAQAVHFFYISSKGSGFFLGSGNIVNSVFRWMFP